MRQPEQASNEELLSGLAGKPAAQVLMRQYGGLANLARASFDELRNVKGVGESKAAAIKSAFLLADRMTKESYAERPLLDTPARIADLLREPNRLYEVERFQVVSVDTRRRLIAVDPMATGTLDTVVVHPREVFLTALRRHASAIALAHNHPSGDPTPSEGDIRVTRDLIRAGKLMRIDVLDHVILGRRTDGRPRDYVSLREAGFFHDS